LPDNEWLRAADKTTDTMREETKQLMTQIKPTFSTFYDGRGKDGVSGNSAMSFSPFLFSLIARRIQFLPFNERYCESYITVTHIGGVLCKSHSRTGAEG
jgi:hypothetical protein